MQQKDLNICNIYCCFKFSLQFTWMKIFMKKSFSCSERSIDPNILLKFMWERNERYFICNSCNEQVTLIWVTHVLSPYKDYRHISVGWPKNKYYIIYKKLIINRQVFHYIFSNYILTTKIKRLWSYGTFLCLYARYNIKTCIYLYTT